MLDGCNEGIALGLAGVPAFFLDGQMVIWPSSGYEGFRRKLDALLG